MSTVLQRQISAPILALAGTAHAIADRSDYSVARHKKGARRTGSADRCLQPDAHADPGAQVGAWRSISSTAHHPRAIGERQDLHSIFQVVVRSLEDNLPIDFGCVCLYDPARQMLTVTQRRRAQPAAGDGAGADRAGAHSASTRTACRAACAASWSTSRTSRECRFPFPQRLARGGLRSLVAAPLLVGEPGVRRAHGRARGSRAGFSSGECEFLRQLSEHVALAAHRRSSTARCSRPTTTCARPSRP